MEIPYWIYSSTLFKNIFDNDDIDYNNGYICDISNSIIFNNNNDDAIKDFVINILIEQNYNTNQIINDDNDMYILLNILDYWISTEIPTYLYIYINVNRNRILTELNNNPEMIFKFCYKSIINIFIEEILQYDMFNNVLKYCYENYYIYKYLFEFKDINIHPNIISIYPELNYIKIINDFNNLINECVNHDYNKLLKYLYIDNKTLFDNIKILLPVISAEKNAIKCLKFLYQFNFIFNFNTFCAACMSGNLITIDFIFNKIKYMIINNHKRNKKILYTIAAHNNNLDCFVFLIKNDFEIYIKNLIKICIVRGSYDILYYILYVLKLELNNEHINILFNNSFIMNTIKNYQKNFIICGEYNKPLYDNLNYKITYKFIYVLKILINYCIKYNFNDMLCLIISYCSSNNFYNSIKYINDNNIINNTNSIVLI